MATRMRSAGHQLTHKEFNDIVITA